MTREAMASDTEPSAGSRAVHWLVRIASGPARYGGATIDLRAGHAILDAWSECHAGFSDVSEGELSRSWSPSTSASTWPTSRTPIPNAALLISGDDGA
jgi:hypothetical protein